MKEKLNIILFSFTFTLCFSQVEKISEEFKTKSIFEITIDSKKYVLEEGDELDLFGKKISVKQLDIKKFNAADLTFEYPSNFGFEFEESEGYKNWTLDGNDYIIMIFDIGDKSQTRDFIENMMNQFGKENCTIKEIKTTIGGRVLTGFQMIVELIGHKLSYNLYRYSSSDNNSKYIAFQDSLNEDGTSSSECLKTLELINNSIQYY